MNIESRLKALIGGVAGRLHTARSRNDQVVTDFRLWMKDAITSLLNEISSFQNILQERAKEHAQTIMPGFTHLQIAQPVSLGIHLDAYAHMLERDKGRFANARERLDESPLGACALSGTSYPIDRAMTAQALGFQKPMQNTMDAIASRDFVLEFLSAGAIAATHLSRLAEELILWTTPQFGYIRLSDRFTTGSSIMPQKKNADAAELVRAKSGKVTGRLMQMLAVMKALPLTYNKDMQEDKESVFDVFDTLVLSLRAMSGMIGSMDVNAAQMLEDAENGYSTATELADWLVKTLKLPFREAHHLTGRIVRHAEKCGVRLRDIPLEELQGFEPRITADLYAVLDPKTALNSHSHCFKG